MDVPILSLPEYETQTAATRDARMTWWREARFGIVRNGTPLDFEFDECRVILRNLPEDPPDAIAGVTLVAMECGTSPRFRFAGRYPQLHRGAQWPSTT